MTTLHELIEPALAPELEAALAAAHAGTDTVVEVRTAGGDRV